jgi:hypothetical protein
MSPFADAMYLTGLTHRDRLFDIACRWLADRVEPKDGRTLTEIFAFERAITAPSVRALVADLSRTLRPGSLALKRVTNKDAVREAILAAVMDPSPRARQLIERYRRQPEEFFPRTPVHMSLINREDGTLAGMVRRKRIRRIAEKVSRYVARQLAGEIDEAARRLAADRARSAGIPLDRMVSTPVEMRSDFTEAERQVATRIRSMEVTLDPELQQVDDVIGVKLIATPEEIERLEVALDEREHTWAFHRKVHEGSYVGTHYLVEIELPPVDRIVDGLRGIDWSFAAGRGLSVFDLESEFYEYVSTGSRTFSLELILTTIDDLVESEFGRGIHEVRILEQRDRAGYSGRIAQNASWIIEYMLCHAISPTAVVEEIPIKIWGRYLRDTLYYAVAGLGDGEPDEWLVPVERAQQRVITL